MRHSAFRTAGYIRAPLLVLVGAGVIVGFGSFSTSHSADQMFEPVSGGWILPGMVYTGDASCSSAACHGSDEAKLHSGQMIGDESTIWGASGTNGDPHANAWKTLKSADSKEIASKLGLAEAHTDDRCLSCHALNAPAAQRGEKFNIESGNSCESCHGPAEKWLQSHAKAGWTAQERSTLGTVGLMKTHGLLDTSDLALRAQMCVSCHLQIDKDMLDAGHPALRFELYGYNNYFFDGQFTPHWEETKGEMRMARQWAAGQAAALDASSRQVAAWKGKSWDTASADALVAMYRQGVDIAKKHFGSASTQSLAKAALTPEKCAAAATELASLAPAAKSTLERKVIAFGVMALTEASFDGRKAETPDALWDAFDVASKGGEGAAFAEAVKAMAAMAK